MDFLTKKEKGFEGDPLIPSFFLTLLFSLLSSSTSFSFFVFLFFLIFSCSFIVRFVSELHGRQQSLYMIMLFFTWLFFSHSISPLFSFLVPLLRHHHGPLPRHRNRCRPHGSLASRRHAPMALGRRATLRGGFYYRGTILGS